MRRLITTIALLSIGGIGLGAGCAPKSVSSQIDETPTVGRDSVVIPGAPRMPMDLVRDEEIVLSGPAAFEMMTVASLARLQATNAEQLASAERALNSGAYLGDPIRVVRIEGQDESGVLGYAVGNAVDFGFETEIIVRFEDGGGEISFEIVGEPLQGGRRMPSMFRVEVRLGDDGGNSAILLLGVEGAAPSELGRADLPDDSPDEFAHRIGVHYAPGTITVFRNGKVVLEEAARLGGGSASAAILARPTESAYILSWTFETLP